MKRLGLLTIAIVLSLQAHVFAQATGGSPGRESEDKTGKPAGKKAVSHARKGPAKKGAKKTVEAKELKKTDTGKTQ
ncbi:MAG: hypothetical protein M3O35_06705 [Acidobacteriota bacterium]|nr:hypothetical protein [Acidobacteriota bacterium]